MAVENQDASAREVKEAIDLLRKETEQHGADSAQAKEMAAKVDKTLTQQEEKSAKIIQDQKALEQKNLDLLERVENFEQEMAKKANSVVTCYKDTAEFKALNTLMKFGEKGVGADEFKTLRMDDGTSGGYLTTTEMDTSIIKTITEISPVRQLARVRTTSKKTLEIPKRTGIPTATYEGEAAAGDESQSVYANEQLTSYRQTVTIPYTLDLLNDSNFDLLSEINADVSEAFASGEGNKFVLGTGAKQPEGFVANAAVLAGKRTSAAAGVVDADDLLLLTGDLKVGYNGMFGFNRQTLAQFRTLKGAATGNDHYVWQAGLGPNQPNTIGGDPYTLIQDMASIASLSYSVIYGDFMKGYTITDRTGLVIVRDEYTGKKNAIVELTFHRWNTGQVVNAEAFKILQTKTT